MFALHGHIIGQGHRYIKQQKKGMPVAKENKPKIDSVSYIYAGTDKEFNFFLKSVIKDYISDDKTVPDKNLKIKNQEKTA